MNPPPLARVRQNIDHPYLEDVVGTARRLILESDLRDRVPEGGTVAVGVGSRGINKIADIARSAVDALKEMGYRPFVVAAMGSHGGATADGQRRLLADYGVTEQAMGAPVKTDMETVVLATNDFGLPIHFDRNAREADGIVLLNRVKPHTDFVSTYESGIIKMLTIGLGKREGAAQVHKLGQKGYKKVLPSVGRYLVKNTRFALGLAILENAHDQTAEIVALGPDDVFEREPGLLEKVRGMMGRLPFDQIDFLVVGELGKNYSGAGMDPNVIGRFMIETQPDFARPIVTRLAVLDVSRESHGNVVGVGFADLTTERLVAAADWEATRINVLTSCCLERSRIPFTFATDREVIEKGLETCWRIDPSEVRMVVIPNTLETDVLWVSKPLEADVRADPTLVRETDYLPMPIGGPDDRLDQVGLFPDSVQGRRAARAAGG